MPNRIIKESIRKSDSIDQLTWFEEVFFYRLMVTCDDYGRYDARPKILKAELFPLKDGITLKQITDALNKLVTVGMAQVYEYDQKPFLQLSSWANHQQIRNKKSKYPEPDINCNQLYANVPVIQSNPNPNPNPNPSIAAAPAPVSEFEKAFADFKEMRKKIKAPMTPKAETLIMSELQKLAGDDEQLKIAILNQSIERSWRGVFPMKEDDKKPQQKSRQATSAAEHKPVVPTGADRAQMQKFLKELRDDD